jgi:hypothetical protein
VTSAQSPIAVYSCGDPADTKALVGADEVKSIVSGSVNPDVTMQTLHTTELPDSIGGSLKSGNGSGLMPSKVKVGLFGSGVGVSVGPPGVFVGVGVSVGVGVFVGVSVGVSVGVLVGVGGSKLRMIACFV